MCAGSCYSRRDPRRCLTWFVVQMAAIFVWSYVLWGSTAKKEHILKRWHATDIILRIGSVVNDMKRPVNEMKLNDLEWGPAMTDNGATDTSGPMPRFVEFRQPPEDEWERWTQKAHEKQVNSPHEGNLHFTGFAIAILCCLRPVAHSAPALLADHPGSASVPEAYKPPTCDPSSALLASCRGWCNCVEGEYRESCVEVRTD